MLILHNYRCYNLFTNTATGAAVQSSGIGRRRCRKAASRRGECIMKKNALSILAAVLMLTLVCASALALTSDMTIKSARAYSDPEMTKYIGTIPEFTAVKVRAYGSYADIVVNDVRCYVNPSTLTRGAYKDDYVNTATLAKNARIYSRPTTTAPSKKNKKAAKAYIYAAKKGMALIRVKDEYCFARVEDLSNLKAK